MADHLLPPSATELLRQTSLAAERATSLPVEIRDEWSPQRCASHMLPWLAWAFGVEEWDVTWTEAQKRAAITSALAVKRTKGTIGAVVSTVESMGLGAQVIEWFNQVPLGTPYTYDLVITAEGAGFSQQQLDLLLALIERTKNVRSHLDELRLEVQSRTTLYTAGAPIMGFNIQLDYGGELPDPQPTPLLLMHLDVDGPDGTLGNASPTRWLCMPNGNAAIDYYEGRFGGSIVLDGAGWITAELQNEPPRLSDFTVELFVNPAAAGSTADARYAQLGNSVWLARSGSTVPHRLTALFNGAGDVVVTAIAASAATEIPSDVWTHVALVREAGEFRLYIGGRLVASNTLADTKIQTTTFAFGADLSGANGLAGHLDEIRVCESAVYTADFTPPMAPFSSF